MAFDDFMIVVFFVYWICHMHFRTCHSWTLILQAIHLNRLIMLKTTINVMCKRNTSVQLLCPQCSTRIIIIIIQPRGIWHLTRRIITNFTHFLIWNSTTKLWYFLRTWFSFALTILRFLIKIFHPYFGLNLFFALVLFFFSLPFFFLIKQILILLFQIADFFMWFILLISKLLESTPQLCYSILLRLKVLLHCTELLISLWHLFFQLREQTILFHKLCMFIFKHHWNLFALIF